MDGKAEQHVRREKKNDCGVKINGCLFCLVEDFALTGQYRPLKRSGEIGNIHMAHHVLVMYGERKV